MATSALSSRFLRLVVFGACCSLLPSCGGDDHGTRKQSSIIQNTTKQAVETAETLSPLTLQQQSVDALAKEVNRFNDLLAEVRSAEDIRQREAQLLVHAQRITVIAQRIRHTSTLNYSDQQALKHYLSGQLEEPLMTMVASISRASTIDGVQVPLKPILNEIRLF